MQETIIHLIRELSKKTIQNGCTEAEAMLAAQKVDELLLKYNLTLSKINLEQVDYGETRINTNRAQRHPIDGAMTNLAYFTDTKVWVSRDFSILQYVFFGSQPDCQMAEYLYRVILSAMENETRLFKMTPHYRGANKKRVSMSFQMGMARRISDRLKQIKDKQKQVVLSSGTDLVVRKDLKLQSEFSKRDIKLKNVKSVERSLNTSAWLLGQAAGENVNFNKPIQGARDFQMIQ